MKNFMDVFNLVAGVCSIIGFIISVFTINKVIKIEKRVVKSSINKNKICENTVMDNSKIVGGNEGVK